jgi:UDP-N-acetylmuramate: L-alanyl-gamma-D-glutamyl-meso-diaminopimelate ligase
MHIHILGICGTFMGGVAVIAKQAGHTVTGCDANVYPPMSNQLEAQGIGLTEGWDPSQIGLKPDLFVIGNVVSRGNPLMEEILNRGLAYISGPQWLAENVLRDKWVLALAGTHGKTTTSAMLAWILEYGGLNPGFLIGGVPLDFGVSARITESGFFVIEADEYDTAFFDKRSKFVHYRPRTAVLNNLEFDHADIFADLAAIEMQFHHLVRTVPGDGLIVANGAEASLRRVLERGCWSPVEWLDADDGWQVGESEDVHSFDVSFAGEMQGRVNWKLSGRHNRLNALAAVAAARHAGVPPALAIEALGAFRNVKRRMEVRGEINGITVYDDFAHHPTAIETTVTGLRAAVGEARILAVFEPRSNTMKMGSVKQALPGSVAAADLVFCYTKGLDWDVAETLRPLGSKLQCIDDIDALAGAVAAAARSGDHIVIMSNGGFGNVHEKLLQLLGRSDAR